MDCSTRQSSALPMVLVAIVAILMQGCLSYRLISQVDDAAINADKKTLVKGRTTLDEVLHDFGAPRQVMRLDKRMALIYMRQKANDHRLSLSVPLVFQAINPSFDISASRAVVRQDILILFLTPEGVLDHYVFGKGVAAPDPKHSRKSTESSR